MKLTINSCDGAYDSLDVRFTKKCDNNCPFCIEKTGVDSFGETNIAELVKSTLQSGIKEILILGGEPFLFINKLAGYIQLIRPHVDKIYVTTSLPNTFNTHPNARNHILEMIDGLNVSIQDTDWGMNNLLLRASSDHNRIEILKNLNIKYADKIRTSINLVQGGIDTWKKMIISIWTLEQLGCKYIKINELQHSPNLYVSYNKISPKRFRLKSPYSHGCHTEVILPNCSCKIEVKRSCFKVEATCKASFMDLLKAITTIFYVKKNKFMVLYENGLLTNTWINEHYH